MSIPGHVHVSEREVAHTWPDGRPDDARWEDCTWCSTVEWVNDTHHNVADTLAEAEALRAASGEPPTGGSNLSNVRAGLAARYKMTMPPVVYGASNLLTALRPSHAAVITGLMGAFPAGHRLRRWDPGFTGAHAVYLARQSDRLLWWCDPLAPKGTYNGETVTTAEVSAFINSLPGGGNIVAPLLGQEEPMRPLPIDDRTPGTITVNVGAQLYLPDLTPKVTASNVNGAYSPFGTLLGGIKYRAAYISTGGVVMLLLVKTTDLTKFSAITTTPDDGITQATVDAAVQKALAADAAADKAAMDAHLALDAKHAAEDAAHMKADEAHAAADAAHLAADATLVERSKAEATAAEKSRLRKLLGL